MTWWRDGVLYQIYPRSFADADGDGSAISRDIGAAGPPRVARVDGIWLNPTIPSPNDDWGYDVADYRGVHPDLGTLEDLDALIEDAGRARDRRPARPRPQPHERPPSLVPRAAPDFYVWADGRDGGPPNNWVSTFGGSAWTLDEATGSTSCTTSSPSSPI